MGIEMVSLAQREAERVAAGMIADRRLYLTADESRVVEEGDPEAAFLFVGVGGELLPRTMEKYGLRYDEGRVRIKAAPKMEDKSIPAPEEDKAVEQESTPSYDPSDYTVAALREMAKAKEVSGYSTMTKDELMAAVFGG